MPLIEQKTAAAVASATAVVLVAVKVAVGVSTGAMSVLASAADSAFDLVISLFNLLVLKNAEKPSDDTYNYGRGKLEAIASIFEGIVIALSAVAIVATAIVKLIRMDSVTRLPVAAWTMGFSMLVTGLLVFYLARVARVTDNAVTKADLVHYKADLLTNAGILVSLLLIKFTGWHAIDPIIAIGVAGYLVYATWPLIRNGFFMLMDRALDESIVSSITEIIRSESSVASHHALRTRQAANVYFVDVHLVFDKQISLWEAHAISDRIAAGIRQLADKRWVFNMHMDPTDDSKQESATGI